MKFLITNDDGYDAEGIEALRTAAATLGDAIVVAPAIGWSGCAHRVTTDQSFRVRTNGENRYIVEATPADCVRVGLHSIVPNVDWVFAGINHGGNLGVDTYLSGTVAAVREAVFSGKPGIAVSQYHRKNVDRVDWSRAAEWLAPVLANLISRPWSPGRLWNINLPHLPLGAAPPEVVFCPVDPSPLHLHYDLDGEVWKYKGNYHDRPRVPGSDIDECFKGKIAVSLVGVSTSLNHDA